MFTEITLKNYRTHRNTCVALHPITLLIGNNNSGKSNLLHGIRHLSRLVWRSDPRRENRDLARVKTGSDYFLHRYRLAQHEEPLAWSVKWQGRGYNVCYELELLQSGQSRDFVRCREKLTLQKGNDNPFVFPSGFDKASNRLELRTRLDEGGTLSGESQRVCREFFCKLGGAYAYQLQPSFLNKVSEEGPAVEPYEKNLRVRIPSAIGFEGGNFQRLVFYAKEREDRVFSRFVALVRRFYGDFHGVRLNNEGIPIWEFDLGSRRTDRPVEEFAPELLSDGFLRAAAIALIVAADLPPSIVMLEEIENGLNPGNISEIMHWLWQAASAQPSDGKSQFILTSHSPSVLRQFSSHLKNVYSLRLIRKSHQSDVRNLNTSLEAMVGIGAIDGTVIETANGENVVEIPPYQLTDLWYSGTIG